MLMRWKTCEVRVDGVPKAQPRTSAFARKMKNGKTVARVFTPGTAEEWKSCVVRDARPVRPETPIAEVPISVTMDLYLPRPKRLLRKKDPDDAIPATTLGDVDNFAKAVLDALTHDGWWSDDKLVTTLTVRKWFHERDGRPGAELRIAWPEYREDPS